jgi:hypothetical protein
VNAGYQPQRNNVDITAAIVQPPFYVPGADAAVNYCTIGAVIGHELTHGFDSQGASTAPPAICATGGRRRPRRNSRSAPMCWSINTTSTRYCRA